MQSLNTQQLFQQAFKLHQNGNLKDAENLYRDILKLNNFHIGANTMLGSLLIQTDRNIEGVKLLKISLSQDDRQFFAHNLLGIGFFKINKHKEAFKSLTKAIKLKPDYIDAHFNLGNVQKKLLKFQDAIISYTNCISLDINYCNAYVNRANIYLENIKDFDKALFDYQKANKLSSNPYILFNYGNALKELRRLDEALHVYEKSIELKPDYAEAYNNRGNALKDLKRFDDAFISYDRAIQIKPDYAEAIFNKSILKLLLGEYKEGWQLYESRKDKEDSKNQYPKFQASLWLGNVSIKDKILLVHSEQGLGDSIQFCRYLPILKSFKPKKIIFHVEKLLLSLLSSMDNEITFLEKNRALPSFDYYCPLMSLPLALKSTLETIPANIPYLKADNVKNKHWQEKLGKQTKPRIGLVWSGSTKHKNDHNRSLKLQQLSSLLKLPFEFHSLQKDIRDGDKKTLKAYKNIDQHHKDLDDFSDTAALVNQMDLIISVDTSVAHLAGALGKKVWILLPFIVDYRWLLDRDDSPWYPTAKLFRQSQIGDWNSVIQQLISELNILISK